MPIHPGTRGTLCQVCLTSHSGPGVAYDPAVHGPHGAGGDSRSSKFKQAASSLSSSAKRRAAAAKRAFTEGRQKVSSLIAIGNPNGVVVPASEIAANRRVEEELRARIRELEIANAGLETPEMHGHSGVHFRKLSRKVS